MTRHDSHGSIRMQVVWTKTASAASASWGWSPAATCPTVDHGSRHVQHSAVPALGTARSRAGGELGGAIGAWSCQLRLEPQPVLEPASVIAHIYTYTGG